MTDKKTIDDVHQRPTVPVPICEEPGEERVNPFRRHNHSRAAKSNPRLASVATAHPRVQTQRLPNATTQTSRYLFSLPTGIEGERWRLDLAPSGEWTVSCVIFGALHIIDHRLHESIVELDGEEPTAILHVGMWTFWGGASGRVYRLHRHENTMECVYEFVRNDPILSLAIDPDAGTLLVSTETSKMYRCDDILACPLDMRRVCTGAVMEHLMIDARGGEMIWANQEGILCSSPLSSYAPRVDLDLHAPLLRADLARDGSLLYALSERGTLHVIGWSASRQHLHTVEVGVVDICLDERHVCHGLVIRGSDVFMKVLS